MAAEKLVVERGGEVMHLEGGLSAWSDQGYPVTEGGGSRLSIQRQVQIAVGGGVLAATLLGAFVWPWALAIAAFLGGGLLFAGLTGTCGLASLLKAMPWNRARRVKGDHPRRSVSRCCS